MKKADNKKTIWGICENCKGTGQIKKRIRKKKAFKDNAKRTLPQNQVTKAQHYTCTTCKGSGLTLATNPINIDHTNLPHVAIIGAGIGGVALAIACLHRGIPFTLFERDACFNARSQGYGLTLQQASKELSGLGIVFLKDGITSTRHVVHTSKGEIIGEWGIRKWGRSELKSPPKRQNIHIARQALRLELLEQLGGQEIVQWNHQLLNYRTTREEGAMLQFKVKHKIENIKADLVVGADGIRSTVRNLRIDKKIAPLKYLGCIVILGICPLEKLKEIENNLLDSATVFQTANGFERIYMMPYSSTAIMWQLSFPISEEKAKEFHLKGAKVLKEEACRRTQWHTPIPEILKATNEDNISGYPVYDRDLLQPEFLTSAFNTTLLGDAAHPMSPFKGQGANQALLDALSLARNIYKGCKNNTAWRENGIRASVLNNFEAEMMARSASKVKSSAAAARLLHSEIVLEEGDGPRGKHRKDTNNT